MLPQLKFRSYSVVLEDVEWFVDSRSASPSPPDNLVYMREVRALDERIAALLVVHMLAEEAGCEVLRCSPSVVLIDE